MDRILVIDLAGTGDLILATPALHALRTHFAGSHLAILVGSHAARVLDHSPDVDAQWVLASPREGLGWWLSVGWDRAMLRQLRAQRFTLVLNCYEIDSWQGSLRLAYYLRQIRAARSVGLDTAGRGWCYTQRIPQTRQEVATTHETSHALRVAQAVGCAPVPLIPRLWVTTEERAQAARQLAAWGCAAAPPIVLSPGASHSTKRWPPSRFVHLGRWLAGRCRAPLLIVGDERDQPVARAVAGPLAGLAINLAGQTTVRELLALLTCARLVVTNDTGTMHMAAALQMPLVALLGPTNRARFGPLGEPARQRVLQPATCRLEDLALADVQQAIEPLLTP